MLEILSAPIWQFVGFVVVVIAIAIPILRRSRKRLWWEVFYFDPLFFEDERVNPDARVEYDDGRWISVHEVGDIAIEVRNSGDVDITEDDYVEPLRFVFGEEALVLAAEVIYEEPDRIGVRLDLGYEDVVIHPVTINAGDAIGLRFLVHGTREIALSDGSIRGVSSIPLKSSRRRAAYFQLLGVVGFVLVGVYVLFPQLLPVNLSGVAAGLAAVAAILVGFGTWLGYKEARWARRNRRYLEEAQARSFRELPFS